MPQKSHRIAAQQANIRKRRKKLSKGPPNIPLSTVPKEAALPVPETHSTAEKQSKFVKHQPEVSKTLRKLVTTELVRICLLMGAIFMILVVVSIILN